MEPETKSLVPKTLEDKPVLGKHLLWVWKAFTELSFRRPYDMGSPRPIPFSEMEAYCLFKAITNLSDRERLFVLTDRLDHAWLALERERTQNAESAGHTTPDPKVTATGNRQPTKAS